MNAREQAEGLKRQAIDLLMKERAEIDQELDRLGYGQEKTAPQKRRGRPPKATLEADQREDEQAESPAEAERASRTV